MMGSPTDAPAHRRRAWMKLAAAAILAIVIGLLYWRYHDVLSLADLARHEATLRRWRDDHTALVYGAAFAIYVAVTGLSLPGAAVMTLLYGWYFGVVRGVILVSFASTAGATVAFLLSRYLLRDWVQSRFGDRLRKFNEALDREGAFFLFTLRLIPAVPFFVINVVMGLTRLRIVTYWWVSQVGMLAGTVVYVYAGSTLPGLAQIADPSQLRTNDVERWPGFLDELETASRGGATGPEARIWELLPEGARAIVHRRAGSRSEPGGDDKVELVRALNQVLRQPDLALLDVWRGAFAAADGPTTSDREKKLTQVNRTLLVVAFPAHIRPPQPILGKELIFAFVLLGLFPFAVKKISARLRRSSSRLEPPRSHADERTSAT